MSDPTSAAAPTEERFLEVLAARLGTLSPSERRVGEFVLAEPAKVIRMSIAALAETVAVSQPTVLRFVRTMGLNSYPELKLVTGQSIVSGTPYIHSEVTPDDNLEKISEKVIDSSIFALTSLRRSLDEARLEQAIDLLATAPRIDCYGTGAASLLAREAQHKLMRFGMPAVTYDDTHIQRLAAASLRSGDVALCFSHTGMVRDIEMMAQSARDCGAKVISVTRPGSALAEASDVLLAVDVHENTEIYAPMVSRVAHAVLIDIICTAMALRGGPKMHERLRAAKDSLGDLRIPQRRERR